MRLFLVICVAILFTPLAHAQQWGDLTGKFVYDGTAPAPAKINVNKDEEVFGKLGLIDETLVVAKEGGIANVVVYCRTANVQVNPELAGNVPPKVVYDNKGGRFAPRVLTLWLDKQMLVLHNSDPVGHNSNVQPLGDAAINPLLPANSSVDHKFNRSQNIPVKVGCNIHPWMAGYILPRSNPYATVSKEDGTFKIEKLPVGSLEFVAWQEKSGYVGPILKDGKPTMKDTLKIEKDGKTTTTDWVQGRFTIDIKPGTNDLGTIKVSPQVFKK
jgi:hypothetical protein